MTTITDFIEGKIKEDFKKTKFAMGGGLSFECSDYEGMYDDLLSFIRYFSQELIEKCGEEIIDIKIETQQKVRQFILSTLLQYNKSFNKFT